jgi:polysaccharide chain length determinant protein (PEP-CTERM system associated)
VDNLPVIIKAQLIAAWRRKWLAIGIAWLVSVIGWVAVSRLPDQYETSARLYIDTDAVLTPLLRGIAVDTGTVNQVEVIRRTMLSRTSLDKLIATVFPELASRTEQDRERLRRRLAETIQVTAPERNLFTVLYRDPNARLAHAVVQSVLAIFFESQATTARAEMDNAQGFLRQQIADYSEQLTVVENRRAEFRARYLDILPGEGNSTSRLQAARATLETARSDLSDNEIRLASLKLQLQVTPQTLAVDAGMTVIVGANGAIPLSPNQQRLLEAERSLDALKLRFTDRHPDVIATKRLIETLRAAAHEDPRLPGDAHAAARSVPNPVFEQIRLRVVEIEANIASLQRKVAVAKTEVDRLDKLAAEAPGIEAEYHRLDRDYTVLKKNREELLARLEQAKIAEAANNKAESVKMRLIDPPQLAQVPVGPKRQVMISGVLLAALGAGGGIVFLMQQLDRSFASVQALRALGVPVLGGVSLVRRRKPWRSRTSTAGFAVAVAMLLLAYGGMMAHSIGMKVLT